MTAVTVPIVETERLLLRGHALQDFGFFADLWSKPDVTKFIGGKPRSEEETWSKFLRMIGHWQAMGFGYWAVEDKVGGALIGEVGVADFKRIMSPSIKGELEAGWVLSPKAQGKGYATEAMKAVLDWADEHVPGKAICAIIEPKNIASIKVAEKLEFTKTAQTVYMGSDIILYHRA